MLFFEVSGKTVEHMGCDPRFACQPRGSVDALEVRIIRRPPEIKPVSNHFGREGAITNVEAKRRSAIRIAVMAASAVSPG